MHLPTLFTDYLLATNLVGIELLEQEKEEKKVFMPGLKPRKFSDHE